MNTPDCAHDADKDWISDQIEKLPPQMRFKAVSGYESVFSKAADNEPVDHKKVNAGRKAANTRLRLFVERFYKAAMGHTIKPPKS